MNLGDVRTLVRTQLDVDEVELPDAHLDWFIGDGFDATLAIETRWPFFQETWEFTATAQVHALDPEVREIVALYDVTADRALELTQNGPAVARWGSPTDEGAPLYWSVYYGTDGLFPNGAISFWPGSSSPRDFRAHTYRKPIDWMADDVTEMDCDHRLQDAVVLYALARAYQKQEDAYLADMYWASWEQKVNQTHDDIMRPNQYTPRILNRGLRTELGLVSLDLN